MWYDIINIIIAVLFSCLSIVKPLEVHVLSSRQPLSADRSYEVQCQAMGSKPPANITWWKDNEKLTNATQTVSNPPPGRPSAVCRFCLECTHAHTHTRTHQHTQTRTQTHTRTNGKQLLYVAANFVSDRSEVVTAKPCITIGLQRYVSLQ